MTYINLHDTVKQLNAEGFLINGSIPNVFND